MLRVSGTGGPGPLRANRDRIPPNAPRDSWRCESTSSGHRRCLAIEPTLVGHRARHAQMPGTIDRATPGYSSGSTSAPSSGTNARTTTCVSSSRSSRSSGWNRRWRHARRRRHGRGASTSRFTGRCWGRTPLRPRSHPRRRPLRRPRCRAARARHGGPGPGSADRAERQPRQCSRRQRAAHDCLRLRPHRRPLTRRGGSPSPASPAPIPRTLMQQAWPSRPPGAALGLTPDASLMLALPWPPMPAIGWSAC